MFQSQKVLENLDLNSYYTRKVDYKFENVYFFKKKDLGSMIRVYDREFS